MSNTSCKCCGQCCVDNGLIPPLIPDRDEGAPEWLVTLVSRLRSRLADIAGQYPCIFLTDDFRCVIHEVYKPLVCKEFLCDKQRNT